MFNVLNEINILMILNFIYFFDNFILNDILLLKDVIKQILNYGY